MDGSSGREETSQLKGLLMGTGMATHAVQGVLALSGVLVLLRDEWRKAPYVLGAAIFITVLSALWVAIGFVLRRRRPKEAVLPLAERSESTYLRGLFPFEKGDRLLGRDHEKSQLLAMLRGLEYRFGFLSGEAGAGKTSLLRAAILPQLEEAQRIVLYVARVGGDPEAAIIKELIASPLFPAGLQRQGALVDVLKQVLSAGGVGSIVVIVDQFEEFFILNRTREQRSHFESVLGAIAQADLKVSFLFALRKEFVDDLLDLGTTVPQLKTARWRYPLRNMSSATAKMVLRKVVADEGLRFSDQLQELLIVDLTRDQKVRPVEFQLVLTHLYSQEIFDVAGYVAIQGAQGVLAHFVTEIISPPDRKTSATEVWTAQQVLRALCDDEFRSRRPVGLTAEELLERVQTNAQNGNQIPASRSELKAALENVLLRGLENFVVIREDEERYNLAHDYLVAPVRDATAGVETTEERANSLLERYIENARTDRVVLPWKSRRFIQRFASPDMLGRSEAKRLFRRSRVQHIAVASGGAAIVLVILGLTLPFGLKYTVSEQVRFDGDTSVSRNGAVVMATNKNKLIIHDLTHTKLAPQQVRLDSAVKVSRLSPRGDVALLLLENGAVYQVGTRGLATAKKVLDSNWLKYRPWELQMGFSQNGNWAYFVDAKGGVFAWPVNNEPLELFKLRFFMDQFKQPVDISVDRPQGPQRKGREYLSVDAGISDSGHVWAVDGTGKLFIFHATEGSTGKPVELLDIKLSFMSGPNVAALPDGSGLLITDSTPEIRFVKFPRSGSNYPVSTIPVNRNDRESLQPDVPHATVSPGMKWLVYRRSFQDFYAVNLQATRPAAGFPAIALPDSQSDSRKIVAFDQTETYAMGMAQDGKFYVWKLDSPPGASAKPVIESANKTNINAVFCPNGRNVIVALKDGGLHAFDFTTPASSAQPLGWIAAGQPIFYRLKDNATVLVHDGSRLAETSCQGELKMIHDHRWPITEVTDDGHGNWIVIAENEAGQNAASRIGKAFYVFGIPVWKIPLAGVDRSTLVR